MTGHAHLDRLLACLDGVKRSGNPGDQYAAKCPAHDDRHASLSVRLGGDKHPDGIMLHCFTGWPQDTVLAAVGLPT